jgi:hypothetical protein
MIAQHPYSKCVLLNQWLYSPHACTDPPPLFRQRPAPLPAIARHPPIHHYLQLHLLIFSCDDAYSKMFESWAVAEQVVGLIRWRRRGELTAVARDAASSGDALKTHCVRLRTHPQV